MADHIFKSAIDKVREDFSKVENGSHCWFCIKPIGPNDKSTWKQVLAWVGGSHSDGATLRENTGCRAHAECINKAKAGQSSDQPDIIEASSATDEPPHHGGQYILDLDACT